MLLAVFGVQGAWAAISDDLTIGAAPYTKTDFSINSMYWGDVFTDGCKSNTKAPDTYKEIGVIADADHYITYEDGGYKFNCTESGKDDSNSAHLVINNTVPGILKVTVKGNSSSGFNFINFSRSPYWTTSGDGQTSMACTDYNSTEGTEYTKDFYSIGKIYIAANYDMTITKIEWVPFAVGDNSTTLTSVTVGGQTKLISEFSEGTLDLTADEYRFYGEPKIKLNFSDDHTEGIAGEYAATSTWDVTRQMTFTFRNTEYTIRYKWKSAESTPDINTVKDDAVTTWTFSGWTADKGILLSSINRKSDDYATANYGNDSGDIHIKATEDNYMTICSNEANNYDLAFRGPGDRGNYRVVVIKVPGPGTLSFSGQAASDRTIVVMNGYTPLNTVTMTSTWATHEVKYTGTEETTLALMMQADADAYLTSMTWTPKALTPMPEITSDGSRLVAIPRAKYTWSKANDNIGPNGDYIIKETNSSMDAPNAWSTWYYYVDDAPTDGYYYAQYSTVWRTYNSGTSLDTGTGNARRVIVSDAGLQLKNGNGQVGFKFKAPQGNGKVKVVLGTSGVGSKQYLYIYVNGVQKYKGQPSGGTTIESAEFNVTTAGGEDVLICCDGGATVDITSITYIPMPDDLIYTDGATQDWTGSNTSWPSGSATYDIPVNNTDNHLRINADDDHAIEVTDDGFVLNAKSDLATQSGYMIFKAEEVGTVKVHAKGTGTTAKVSQIADATPTVIDSWNNYKLISSTLFNGVDAALAASSNRYKLRIVVSDISNSSYTSCVSLQQANYANLSDTEHDFIWIQSGSSSTNAANTASFTSTTEGGYIDYTLTAAQINSIKSSEGLMINGAHVTIKDVYLIDDNATMTESQLSVSGGTAPKDRWIDVPTGDDFVYTMPFFDADPTRRIFVGGTAGLTITEIEWIPGTLTDANHEALVPVTGITTWSKANNYGGFFYKADGTNATNILVDIINPGTTDGSVPANTLYIYGADLTKPNPDEPSAVPAEQVNFTPNGVLALGKSAAVYSDDSSLDKRYEGDHFVEFKVTGRGVVKLVAAPNGPNERTMKVGTAIDDEFSIMEEGSEDSHAGYANDQEHAGQVQRHQHVSSHVFYCYFDGTGASATKPVSIYVYGRGGTNIDEITWLPNMNIEDAAGGDLNPDNCLHISDVDGIVENSDGTQKIPETILLNPYKGNSSYTFYAEVDPTVRGLYSSRKVSQGNMWPKWTTSQRGRSNVSDINVISAEEDVTTVFQSGKITDSATSQEYTPAGASYKTSVSQGYPISVATRKVSQSEDANHVYAAENSRNSWGVAYVIAGTTEGDKTDHRRVEVAGPPTGMDVLASKAKTFNYNWTQTINGKAYKGSTNVVYTQSAVKGKAVTLTVNPYLLYNDLDAALPADVYGKKVRIKVDNPTVTWTVLGGNATVASTTTDENADLSTASITISNEAADNSKIYVSALIQGIEEVTNASGTLTGWRYVPIVKVFELEAKANGLYLTRVLPEGDETYDKPLHNADGSLKLDNYDNVVTERQDTARVWDVSVTDPIVYKATGNLTVTKTGEGSEATYSVKIDDTTPVPLIDGSLTLRVTLEDLSRSIDVPCIVQVVEKADGVYDIFLVYDVVAELQKNNSAQHMDYSSNDDAAFQNSGSVYGYLNGTSGDHTVYDFKFRTVDDYIGDKLETFIYNVTQRTNAGLKDDFTTANKILNSHYYTNDYTDTKSWYCNKRSYIETTGISIPSGTWVDNPSTLAERIQILEAASNATITLSPYNPNLETEDSKRGKIKSIEVNCHPTYDLAGQSGDNSGKISVERGSKGGSYGSNAKSITVNAANNYTAVWEFEESELTRYAQIKFIDALEIDQIKVNYYSAVRDERTETKLFSGYDELNTENSNRDWGHKVISGIEIESGAHAQEFWGDNTAESNIKLRFVDDNKRHFAIRESWSRYTLAEEDFENGIYRGAPKSRDFAKTTLVIRDDKTLPCEMYFFTKNNVAEISSVEFICENDENNKLDPVNLFCTSDPRFNLDVSQNNNFTGCPFEKITTVENDEVSDALGTGENASNFFKLRYVPESPTNLVYISSDPDEVGYLFVRKIIVKYDGNARRAAYKLLNPTNSNKEFTANSILSVDVATTGVKLQIPKDNTTEAYTVKRTSTRTNISSEVPLSESASKTASYESSDYRYPLLQDYDPTKFTNYLHRKFYTVRAIDHERLVSRQLVFRTASVSMPKIKLNGTTNTELVSETPIEILGTGDIKIQKSEVKDANGNTIHAKDHQVIIYTTDGSAPAVTFGPDGRTVTSINGTCTRSDVTLSSSDLFTGGIKSIVIKAIVLPTVDVTSNTTPTVEQINTAGTYGETSDITRANYIYVNPETTHLTATTRTTGTYSDTYALDWNNGSISGNITTDKGVFSLRSLYDMTENDRFHAGMSTEVKNGGDKPTVKMIYGGYELYDETNKSFAPTNAADNVKNDGFRRSILTNDYWHVVGNDLTPYRGLSGVIGGDTYIVSNIEPLNENALYVSDVSGKSEITHQISTPVERNGIRVFGGQFDYKKLNESAKYAKIWQLPCYGDHFKYEPRQNGTLTVYVKQQGVLEQNTDGTLDDMLLRYRPVFVLDEVGETPDNLTASTTSKVSGDWMTATQSGLNASKYLTKNGTAVVDASGTTVTYSNGDGATDNLYNMCQAWIADNTADGSGNVEYGDRAYASQGVMNMYGEQGAGIYTKAEPYRNALLLGDARGSGTANGFVIISEGYVKYKFNVKAGKTYFVFAANGNLGLCSYEFNASSLPAKSYNGNSSNAKTVTINALDVDDTPGIRRAASVDIVNDAETVIKANKDTKVDEVVLKRNFTKGQWSGLVLPFTVSNDQLREVFGDGVKVSHFNDVTYERKQVEGVWKNVGVITIKRHVNQEIPAGVPVFIKSDKTYSGSDYPTFTNVTFETTDVVEVPTQITGDNVLNYKCVGTFTERDASNGIKDGDIYMNNTKGAFALREKGTSAVPSTRVWLTPGDDSSSARLNTIASAFYSTANDVDPETNLNYLSGDGASIEIVFEEIDVSQGGKVYNLKGQLVRDSSNNLKNLPKGVYIINGVKQIVK